MIDKKLLCVPYRSRNTQEDPIISGAPECLEDPADCCSFEPEKLPHYQQWLMIWMEKEKAYKIINRHSGMLLCVQSRTHKENQEIVHYHDQARNFQWWEVQALPRKEFKIINKQTEKMLTAKDGFIVQQTSNNSSLIQLWNIIPLEHSGYVGEYQIQNDNAKRLLSIKGQSLSNNAQAVIYDNQTGVVHEEFSNFQLWHLFAHGWDKGGFLLQNVHSGKLLCIAERSMNSSSRAIQYQDQGFPFQKWQLEPVSPDKNLMTITNFNSGLVLSVRNSALHNDALVVQYKDEHLSFQVWEFIKLSEEIDLKKLSKFYKTPPEHVDQQPTNAANLSPGLLQWYKHIIQMFMLEVPAIIGVFVQPSQEQLSAINCLVLGNLSLLKELQVLLETAVTFNTLIAIVKFIQKEDLWNRIFGLLLQQVWSLPTLVKATAIINSIIAGAGTERTFFLLKKSVAALGILHSTKPKSN